MKKIFFIFIFTFFSNTLFATQYTGNYANAPIFSTRDEAANDYYTATNQSNCSSANRINLVINFTAGVYTYYSHPSNFPYCTNNQSIVVISADCATGTGMSHSGNLVNCSGPPPPPDCVSGTTTSTGYYEIGTDPQGILDPVVACVDNCTSFFNGSGSAVANEVVNGEIKYYANGSFILDGSSCTTANNEPSSANTLPPFSCSGNQTVVNIGSNYFCQDNTTGQTVSNKPIDQTETINTTENTTTTTTITDNGNGTSTVVTLVTYPDGSTDTTTTTKNNIDVTETNGTTTTTSSGTTTSGDLLNDFCKLNPNTTVCAETFYQGTNNCDNPPICQGDAIQCAINLNIWKLNCELTDTDTTNLALTSNYEGDVATDFGNTETLETWSQGTDVDISDPLGGYTPNVTAACPSDYIVITSHGTLTIPFSYICQLADLLRVFVLIAAYMSASLIYYNGLIKEA